MVVQTRHLYSYNMTHRMRVTKARWRPGVRCGSPTNDVVSHSATTGRAHGAPRLSLLLSDSQTIDVRTGRVGLDWRYGECTLFSVATVSRCAHRLHGRRKPRPQGEGPKEVSCLGGRCWRKEDVCV